LTDGDSISERPAAAARESVERGAATRALVFALTFGISLAAYAVTLPQEVGLEDSAELTLQVYRCGVTHPPGHPLYTLLGRALFAATGDAATATNWLSALATSALAGVLSVMILDATGVFLGALLVPLMFALSPRVWSLAVATEVYNVNGLLLAISYYFVERWNRSASQGALVGAAAAYGLSLGIYLGNALLLPAYIYLLLGNKERRATQLLTAASIVLALALTAVGFTAVRSFSSPPIGSEFLPQSIGEGVKFFSGGQYRATEQQESSFYFVRPLEHGWYFAKNYLLVGLVLGVVGWIVLWQRERRLATFYGLLLAINLGYFTFYYAHDYFMMVTPSYIVFTILCGNGFAAIWNRSQAWQWLAGGGAAAACVLLVAIQFGERRERAGGRPVTELARSSFAVFPRNALVISRWGVFPVLLYFQTTAGERPDCTLLERVDARRYYGAEVVESYRSALEEQVDSRPVVIDKADVELRERYRVTPLDENWFLVEPRDSTADVDP
jgi:hypothetical protein